MRNSRMYALIGLIALLSSAGTAWPSGAEIEKSHTDLDGTSMAGIHEDMFHTPLFQEKPTPCDALHFNYEFTDDLSGGHRHDEENGESLDEHVFTLSFARSYHGRLGFEVAVPWIVENRSGQTRRRIGDLHASLKAASALAGPLMHGIGLGTGVPTDEDGHAHIEPSYSIGYPGRRLQSAVSLSLEIPFRDGDEDTTLKYTTYMLAVVWERLHIIGEILGERIVRGEERGENSLDVAAGFRVFPFDDDHTGFGAGIKIPLSGRDCDYGLIFSLMRHF